MKKKFFYIAMVALALTGCSDSLSTIGSSDGNSEIRKFLLPPLPGPL